MGNIILTKDSLNFMHEVKKNNTVMKGRDWYHANKDRFEAHIKMPLTEICLKVGNKLQKEIPDICIDPRRNLFRIHRDLRFTHDHRPFKEWIAFKLWIGKVAEKKVRASFYFHLETNELFLGAGMWHFTPAQLKAFREILLNDYQTKELQKILKACTKKDNKLYPPEMKKVPPKFQKESLFPEGYLYRGLALYRSYPKVPKEIYSEDVVNFTVKAYKSMIPFVEWLDENVCKGNP